MAITGLYGTRLVLSEVMGTARSVDFWRDLVRNCTARFGSEGGAEMSRYCPIVSSKSTSALAHTDQTVIIKTINTTTDLGAFHT